MANTDLAVRIATILDATGLKKADKAVNKFEKNVKSLGRTLGIALSGAAITAYGKAAVKAFAEDEAAAQRLATAVSNIGLSLFTQDVEDFIAKTETSAGILDDKLRPAMQALITTTGSFTKSQELLNNAITISRASGVDLATVAQDLANGYVGITRGLKKYNTGLTQTELKTKSFAEVLGVLLTNSAGAADAYLETTSFKMESLAVAAANAQEKIGEGLVDALAILGGGSTTEDAMKTIDDIAGGINAITKAAATAIGALVKLYKGLDFITSFGGITGDKGKIANYVREYEAGMAARKGGGATNTEAKTKQQTAAEVAAAKRAKELAALQAKQVKAQKALTAEQKKQALAKKQSALFDLEQIGIIAALKGNLSEEERDRLKLQLAILQGNDVEATALSQKIANSIDSTGKLALSLRTLPDANNPFKSWDAFLDSIIAKARLAASIGGNGSMARGESFATLTPTVQSLVAGGGGSAGSTSAGDVYITVNGSVLSEQDLVLAVQNGLNYNSLAGKKSDIGRIAGMFG
jgi:hypothetical protein